MNVLYRIEDADGRGPFRPGFTVRWRDQSGPDLPPPWVEAGISLEEFAALFGEYPAKRGCACRSIKQLFHWFSPRERRRLANFGFQLTRIEGASILLETETQVVFEITSPTASVVMNRSQEL